MRNWLLQHRLPLILAILASFTHPLFAQSALSKFQSNLTLNAGALISAFDPDYGPNNLAGIGVWADAGVVHGFGLEAEGRWLRLNEYQSVNQDHYLIGPRYEFRHLERFSPNLERISPSLKRVRPYLERVTPYAKILGGSGYMNFQNHIATGHFGALAYGGGLDFRLNRRVNIRALDVEIQQWPQFAVATQSLHPVGVSAGVSYRIF